MITIREAALDDEHHLLAWRNDAVTRALAFTQHEITADEHSAWFRGKLADARCVILIAEEDGQPVAQVRFDRVDARIAEAHIAVDPAARGRGVGRSALRLALPGARRALGVDKVLARIKRENTASLRAFHAAGFSVVGERDDVVELERDIDR
jgi:UDP-2,4-diacetamido-2,4,6-trideoxy-beta-L-altropyranose hydrolase